MNTLENDITEAIFAAEDALQHLYQAKKFLKKARNWGFILISLQVVSSPLSSSTIISKTHRKKSDMQRLL